MARRHGLMQNDAFVMGFLDLGVFFLDYSPQRRNGLSLQIYLMTSICNSV